MAEHRPIFSVRAMCRCLRLHPSGFYAWVKNPVSHRAQEDERQTKLLKEAWEESGNIYGYPLPDRVMRSMIPKGVSCMMISAIWVRRVVQIVWPDWPDWLGYTRKSDTNAAPASMVASHQPSLTIR